MAYLPDEVLLDRAEGGCLPAFVLGWDAPLDRGAPSQVVGVDHQYAGYSCHQAVLTGLVFPLHANLDRAKRDPRDLLKRLGQIAESAGLSPVLYRNRRHGTGLVEEWGYTHGQPMTRDDLRRWDELLGAYYELPPLEEGSEALLTFSPEPLPSFIGWRALASTEASWSTVVVEHDTLDALVESRPSDRASSPMRLYLLWENSD